MISMLSGKVDEVGGNHITLDVNGVGYKIFMAGDALHGLKKGSTVRLFTHLAVREDAMDLYGFPSKKDLQFFELLISVSGIGPKSALNILSLASADTLLGAIKTGSTAHLVKISGIGKKTAEKIVLELREKVGAVAFEAGGSISSEGLSADLDAIEALTALGYSADEAREALKKVGAKVSDVGDKVKAALKMLG